MDSTNGFEDRQESEMREAANGEYAAHCADGITRR
jgi:hypothetical protein